MPETVEALAASPVAAPGPLYERLKPGPGRSAAEVAEHQCARLQAAMLALVAERGYRSVTVRDLAQVAGVSSRAFYKHYSSKEECFLCTHELITRRIDRRIAAAREGEEDWRACLLLTIDVYLRELQGDPQAARLLLVDSYVAGQSALGHVRRAERDFELRLVECFDLAGTGMVLPPLVARGIAGGIMCVARSHLTSDLEGDLADLSEGLASWAGAVFELVLSSPEDESTASHQNHASASAEQRSSWPAADERGLIVTALAKLAAAERYHELTVRKVRTSAGASNKKFTAHFTDVDDCFKEAVELYVTTVVAGLTSYRESDASGSQDEESVDAVGLLCERVANDSAFVTLCFADIFGPGLDGARCLDRVIEGFGVVLSDDVADIDVSSVTLRASAAAVWAALREEILCGRAVYSANVLSQLRMLVPSDSGPKDRKRLAQLFDQRHPRRDADEVDGTVVFAACRNDKVRNNGRNLPWGREMAKSQGLT